MELPKAIKQVLSELGTEYVLNVRFDCALNDYAAFEECPPARRIIHDVVAEGYAQLLYDMCVEDKSANRVEGSSSANTLKDERMVKVSAYMHEFISKTGYNDALVNYVFQSVLYGLGYISHVTDSVPSSNYMLIPNVDSVNSFNSILADFDSVSPEVLSNLAHFTGTIEELIGIFKSGLCDEVFYNIYKDKDELSLKSLELFLTSAGIMDIVGDVHYYRLVDCTWKPTTKKFAASTWSLKEFVQLMMIVGLFSKSSSATIESVSIELLNYSKDYLSELLSKWNKSLEGVTWNVNKIIRSSQLLLDQWKQIVPKACQDEITTEQIMSLLSVKYPKETIETTEWSVGKLFEVLYRMKGPVVNTPSTQQSDNVRVVLENSLEHRLLQLKEMEYGRDRTYMFNLKGQTEEEQREELKLWDITKLKTCLKEAGMFDDDTVVFALYAKGKKEKDGSITPPRYNIVTKKLNSSWNRRTAFYIVYQMSYIIQHIARNGKRPGMSIRVLEALLKRSEMAIPNEKIQRR